MQDEINYIFQLCKLVNIRL